MDSNIVLTESGRILELQVTAEDKSYDMAKLQDLVNLATKGIAEIIRLQYDALKQK
jgi:ribonuclease PH